MTSIAAYDSEVRHNSPTRGATGEKKWIVFCDDSEIRDEDTLVDPGGETPTPEKGQIIEKHRQMWRVTFVKLRSGAGKDGSPVHKVYSARA